MTRRQRVWAYLDVVVATLAAWLGTRSLAALTPAPFATIDEPAPSGTATDRRR